MTDKEAREFIQIIFDEYKNKREKCYNCIDNSQCTNAIINAYIMYVKKPKFSIIVDKYKKEYIHNEARVENNTTKEEKKGLGSVYDYISEFDWNKDQFNIFITSLRIHSRLYSFCPYKEFGGKLRDKIAFLEDTNIEVIDADTARKYFNSLITKSDNIFIPLHNGNIIEYINKCIYETVNLIKIQPFNDGNKRTFRAILNLLLKRINIPPIYIEKHERPIYKKALLEAMKNNDYTKIIGFYHFKICDSIMNLDINNSMINDDEIQYKKVIK